MIADQAGTILVVDDEPQACKWFERSLSDEFKIITAPSTQEALAILRARGDDIAVLITDYRMPGDDGLQLLAAARRDHRHVLRLLITAFADKEVAIRAVNQGEVFRLFEKPLDLDSIRATLRTALNLYQSEAHERLLRENRASAMRETLGFVAHELNTPLTTVRGYLTAVRQRLDAAPVRADGAMVLTGDTLLEINQAIDGAERRTLFSQAMVGTFVQSARDAYPDAQPVTTSAAALVRALLDEFPFESNALSFVSCHVDRDFSLPGRRDLLFLVLCSLTRNALRAMSDTPDPRLEIRVGSDAMPTGLSRPWIRLTDNGRGIDATVLRRLTHQPVTASQGGSGMGLVFCRRVIESISGAIEILSEPGQGASVSIYFQPVDSKKTAEESAP